MPAASLTHPSLGALSFLVARSASGWPVDQADADEEELRSPGVDGRRWRTTSDQHTQFQISTLIDCTDYKQAITLARKYLACKSGEPVILTATIAGVSYTWRNVHIVNVQPQPEPGTVTGAGTSSNTTAHVNATWDMILMDTAATGEG